MPKRSDLDLEPVLKLLQRDVPAAAMPYFKALRSVVWEIERLRRERDQETELARKLAAFGEATGASPWT